MGCAHDREAQCRRHARQPHHVADQAVRVPSVEISRRLQSRRLVRPIPLRPQLMHLRRQHESVRTRKQQRDEDEPAPQPAESPQPARPPRRGEQRDRAASHLHRKVSSEHGFEGIARHAHPLLLLFQPQPVAWLRGMLFHCSDDRQCRAERKERHAAKPQRQREEVESSKESGHGGDSAWRSGRATTR